MSGWIPASEDQTGSGPNTRYIAPLNENQRVVSTTDHLNGGMIEQIWGHGVPASGTGAILTEGRIEQLPFRNSSELTGDMFNARVLGNNDVRTFRLISEGAFNVNQLRALRLTGQVGVRNFPQEGRSISMGLVEGAVVTLGNTSPTTSNRSGTAWRRVTNWRNSEAKLFVTNANTVANRLFSDGTQVATRRDDGRDIQIFGHNLNNHPITYFTSVARSCCDGAIPNVRRPHISVHHGTGNRFWDHLSITDFAIDPFDIPYVALPFEANNQTFLNRGVLLGDIVAVIHNNNLVFGIYATNGPAGRIGEVSMRMQRELFNNENSGISGCGERYDVTYIVFHGSRSLLGINSGWNAAGIPRLTFDNIQVAGRQLWGV